MDKLDHLLANQNLTFYIISFHRNETKSVPFSLNSILFIPICSIRVGRGCVFSSSSSLFAVRSFEGFFFFRFIFPSIIPNIFCVRICAYSLAENGARRAERRPRAAHKRASSTSIPNGHSKFRPIWCGKWIYGNLHRRAIETTFVCPSSAWIPSNEVKWWKYPAFASQYLTFFNLSVKDVPDNGQYLNSLFDIGGCTLDFSLI